MFYAIHLLVLGANQTLLLALLPQVASLLGFGSDANEWGMLILIMNLNLLSYWFGSGWWGKAIGVIGLKDATRIASIGLIVSTVLFVCLIFFTPSWLILIAVTRLATGCFTSAFLPIAQTNLALAHQQTTQKSDAKSGNTRVAALSKLSSHITIGRFIGPIIVLLPIPLYALLIAPAVITLLTLFMKVPITDKNTQRQANLIPAETQLNAFKKINKFGISAALLTTALVAIVQLILLPFITQLGYSEVEASQHYAKLLLFISCLVILFQRWMLPKLAKRDTQETWYAKLLLLSVVAGSACLVFLPNSWSFLLLGLALLALGIAGLPSWYTHQLMQQHEHRLPHSQISGVTAQSHTIGHLLGTGLAAFILSSPFSMHYLLLPTAILLAICVIQLKRVSAPELCEPEETAPALKASELHHPQQRNNT
ncbi:MFS transporter [Alteromonas sp. a30]|uniref:MFS transporter n=1 Tax=Alteromonas sp. a30 TaxID=2730917 RepID=UPI00227FCC25|nr:MFS transporter [Alteromonas sp. a30]MCY7295223.1 MFS transporter [Alteromonas sp. a30]